VVAITSGPLVGFAGIGTKYPKRVYHKNSGQ